MAHFRAGPGAEAHRLVWFAVSFPAPSVSRAGGPRTATSRPPASPCSLPPWPPELRSSPQSSGAQPVGRDPLGGGTALPRGSPKAMGRQTFTRRFTAAHHDRSEAAARTVSRLRPPPPEALVKGKAGSRHSGGFRGTCCRVTCSCGPPGCVVRPGGRGEGGCCGHPRAALRGPAKRPPRHRPPGTASSGPRRQWC